MMEKPEGRWGKIIMVFAGFCVKALPFIVCAAFSAEGNLAVAENTESGLGQISGAFYHKSASVFHIRHSEEYPTWISTERTLSKFYSRRQFTGSPPFIPHVLDEYGAKLECLACHAKGGFASELKKYVPITPHPEQIACRQCHVELTTNRLFVKINWVSLASPRLGRPSLPGAPPPIAHSLQMRINCNACHMGPGAVVEIRVNHQERGDCRQCHVSESNASLFKRKSESK